MYRDFEMLGKNVTCLIRQSCPDPPPAPIFITFLDFPIPVGKKPCERPESHSRHPVAQVTPQLLDYWLKWPTIKTMQNQDLETWTTEHCRVHWHQNKSSQVYDNLKQGVVGYMGKFYPNKMVQKAVLQIP